MVLIGVTLRVQRPLRDEVCMCVCVIGALTLRDPTSSPLGRSRLSLQLIRFSFGILMLDRNSAAWNQICEGMYRGATLLKIEYFMSSLGWE